MEWQQQRVGRVVDESWFFIFVSIAPEAKNQTEPNDERTEGVKG